MKVVVAGPGLMGSQIGVEYALGGHSVRILARDAERATSRIDATFRLVRELELRLETDIEEAQERVSIVTSVDRLDKNADLIVESIVELLDDKVQLLRQLAARQPNAILASNTSSLSITEIGHGAGAPERTIGTHYWNPPLLMPLVELVSNEQTDPDIVEEMSRVLTGLGKTPIVVQRDVPGFVWNRMQLALLREAVWLAENQVASPEAIDQVVREGLARRWRYTGPFQTVALGGAETFERIAANLWPVLSCAAAAESLGRWLHDSPVEHERIRLARDRGLLDDLRRERATSEGGTPAG